MAKGLVLCVDWRFLSRRGLFGYELLVGLRIRVFFSDIFDDELRG